MQFYPELSMSEEHDVKVKRKGGGYSCCVPGCHSNSVKHRGEVSFFRLPKDAKLRQRWLCNISRQGEKKYSLWSPKPEKLHSYRVCSLHFECEKTYLNKDTRVPTIFPLAKSPRRVVVPRRKLTRVDRASSSLNTSTQRTQSAGSNMSNSSNKVRQSSKESSSENDMEADAVQVLPAIKSEYTQTEGPLGHSRDVASVSIQTEISDEVWAKENRLKKLIKENLMLKKRITHMKIVSSKSKCTYESLVKDNKMLAFYTGFKCQRDIDALFQFLEPDLAELVHYNGRNATVRTDRCGGRPRSLTHKDELVLVLIRLHLGILEQDIAHRFCVSQPTVSRIWITWINFLEKRLCALPTWPSHDIVNAFVPEEFQASYPSTRVIFDCSDLFLETPSCPRVQSETSSSYKQHNTCKGLIAIAPDGFISFVSDLTPGRLSDKGLTERCGEPLDSVMADRGFLIETSLNKKGVKLNIPPFLSGSDCLSVQEEERDSASLKIRIERVISRIKTCKILKQSFPLSMAPEINKIWKVCCYLVNFTQGPILERKDSDT